MVHCCSSRCPAMKVFLALYVFWFLIFITEAAPTDEFDSCSNRTTYTPHSTYQVNLNSLLSILSSNNTRNNLFYNATAGNSAPDIAYGLFMCRGDVTFDTCHDCVVTATREIVQRCPKKKRAYIWYNECMLRYDNNSFFSIMELKPIGFVWNLLNLTYDGDSRPLMEDLGNAFDKIATRASSDESAINGEQLKGFATGETNFRNILTLYILVQCTPDISGTDCYRCLHALFSRLTKCCSGMLSARFFFSSCYTRYETYQFYNNITSAAAPLPSPTLALPPPGGNGRLSAKLVIAIVVGVVVCILLITLGFCFLRRRAKKYDPIQEATGMALISDIDGNGLSKAESLQYDLSTIGAATNNFSAENRVGKGGFGEVFKGTLSNGQEVAVKRLSKGSGQGVQEFKNEVVLIAKLQHRNLVRLIGFCLEREEKILTYKFMPNKSLDYFLFDSEKQRLLDWSTRYKIIRGIALGILYLHEHSRLRIIHRDLKVSNILLDEEMNPKISDFGMARMFGIDQSQANTNRVVGTFGYMAPEYIMHGQFSIKSDVFSFGVLTLEIVSGKKCNSFYQSGGSDNLLSHAWKHWKDGTSLDLVDPTLGDSAVLRNEVIQCINIGLLCVQEHAHERPTMTSVVHMLNSCSSVTLPLPQQPAFFVGSRTETMIMRQQSDSKSTPAPWSVNEVSISEFYPR